MRSSFTLVLTLLIPLLSDSQEKKTAVVDSLKSRLVEAVSDTAKIKLLDRISYEYSLVDYRQGIYFGEQADKLSRKVHWEKGIASANIDLGLNYVAKCDYVKAAYHYETAAKIYKSRNDKLGLSSVYANTALMFMVQSAYEKALDYSFRALFLFEELDNTNQKAVVLENIGTIYLEQGKSDRALKYYTKALKNYVAVNDVNGTARNLANQGIILNTRGNYEKALEYHLQALKINEEKENWNAVQINLANVGITYVYLKKYEKALAHHLRALELSRRLFDTKSQAINLGNIGELYYFLGSTTPAGEKNKKHLLQATEYLERAVKTCKEINFLAPCIEFCQFLYKTHALVGNYKASLEAYEDYSATKDSVYSQETNLKMAELEARRSLDLKNRDIVLKEKQLEIEKLKLKNSNNERLLLSGAILLLCIVIFWLFRIFRRRALKHRKTLSAIAYIQSHEVRAPLARILGLAGLFDHKNPAADINKKVVGLMYQSALELDHVVKKTVNAASENRESF